MRKSYKILFLSIGAVLLALVLIISFLMNGPEGKAKDDFIENFDLKLIGKVLSVNQNRDGQYLVCLKVIESNHENYFPIHDPNKYRSTNSKKWEKRFFVKVQDSLAIMILINDGVTRVIHNRIKEGGTIKINMNGKKGYEIFDMESNQSIGKIHYIMTAPIRDNIKNSCLRNLAK